MIVVIESKKYLDANVDALVNFVDCTGRAISESGDKIFEEYPEMYKKYKLFCDSKKFKPGMVWYFKGNHDKAILNFAITEDSYMNDFFVDETVFSNGIEKVVSVCEDKDIASIAILVPDVEWSVNNIYEKYFYDNENLTVEVYGRKKLVPSNTVFEETDEQKDTIEAETEKVEADTEKAEYFKDSVYGQVTESQTDRNLAIEVAEQINSNEKDLVEKSFNSEIEQAAESQSNRNLAIESTEELNSNEKDLVEEQDTDVVSEQLNRVSEYTLANIKQQNVKQSSNYDQPDEFDVVINKELIKSKEIDRTSKQFVKASPKYPQYNVSHRSFPEDTVFHI